MESLIRRAVTGDVRDLIDLSVEAINGSYRSFLGDEGVDGYLSSGAVEHYVQDHLPHTFVITVGDEVAGYAVAVDERIDLMMVAQGRQRCGLGTRLLAHMEAWLFDRFEHLELESFEPNQPANAFYVKNGWSNVSRYFDGDSKVIKIIMGKTRSLPGDSTRVALTVPTAADRPLVHRWLRADHVRRFWGEPEPTIELLRASAPGGQRRIILAAGHKVGLVLWQHPTRKELEDANLEDIPSSVYDIDIMIGEKEMTGQGIGTTAIRMVGAQALADPAVPYCMACTRLDNSASRRAFEKAGFVQDREFDDPVFGRCLLLMLRRPS